MEAAAPNNPCAKARSFCGNHSALLFVVPAMGRLHPSPTSSGKRSVRRFLWKERPAHPPLPIPAHSRRNLSGIRFYRTTCRDKLADAVCNHKENRNQPRMSFAFCDASGSLRSIRPRSMAIPSRLVTKVTPFLLFHLHIGYADRIAVSVGAVRIYWSPTNARGCLYRSTPRLGQKTIVDISHPHIVERASIQIIDDGYQHD
jgi:hypothetical protein